MALLINHGVMRLRMRGISLGQQHSRSQVHRLSPELCQHFALDSDVFAPGRVFRNFDDRYGPVEAEANVVSADGVEMDALRIAVKVSGREVELLAFPLVQVRHDGVSVGPAETRVDVEYHLDVVVPGRQLSDRLQRIP